MDWANIPRRRLNVMAAQLQAWSTPARRWLYPKNATGLPSNCTTASSSRPSAASANLAAARAWLARDAGEADDLAEAEQLLDGLRQELAALILDLRPPALEGRSLPNA